MAERRVEQTVWFLIAAFFCVVLLLLAGTMGLGRWNTAPEPRAADLPVKLQQCMTADGRGEGLHRHTPHSRAACECWADKTAGRGEVDVTDSQEKNGCDTETALLLEARRERAVGVPIVERENLFRDCVTELGQEVDVDAYLTGDLGWPEIADRTDSDWQLIHDLKFCDCLATDSEGIFWSPTERHNIQAECLRTIQYLAARFDDPWQPPALS